MTSAALLKLTRILREIEELNLGKLHESQLHLKLNVSAETMVFLLNHVELRGVQI